MDRMRLFCLVGGVSASAVLVSSRNKDRSIPRKPDTGHEGGAIKIDARRRNFSSVINQARQLTLKLKNEVGAPGIVVGVSVDGEVVWEEGMGFADLENQVPANGDTIMRIASISKSLTAAVVGRLFQEGAIDLDQPIQKYVPSFPIKTFGDKTVTITTRQLMSHLSGIRHYSKKKDTDGSGDGQFQEFYSKERFESVDKALSIFKDDELVHAPGSKYLYTTYGWTVVSAVMEGATGKTYPQLMRVFLRRLGMRRTYLDEPEPIIYGRSKCYMKNKNGKLVNSPYVDNSCKWAGGGFLSTAGDLLKFANAMLYSYQFDDSINASKSVSNAKSNSKPNIKDTTIGLKTEEEFQETIDKKKQVKNEYTIGSRHTSIKNEVPRSSDAAHIAKNIEISTSKDNSNATVIESSDSSGKRKKSPSAIDQMENTKVKEVPSPEVTSKATVVASSVSTSLMDVVEGVGNVGSYVWNMFGKEMDKSPSSSDETSKEKAVPTGEETSKAEVVASSVSSGLRTVTEGVGNVGSYVWNMFGKEMDKSPSSSDETSKGKAVPTGEETSKATVVASSVSSGLRTVTEGVGNVDSYVWNMFGKEMDKSPSPSDETSKGKAVSPGEETSKATVVASSVSSGLRTVTEGVGNVGSYVWNMFGKEMDKSPSPSDETSKEKAVPTGEETSKAEVVASSVSSGLRTVTERVGNVGSYVWNMFGKEMDKSPSSSDETSKGKAVSPGEETSKATVVASSVSSGLRTVTEGVGNVGSYVWNMFGKEVDKSPSSSDETSKGKAVPPGEETSKATVVASSVSSGLRTVTEGVGNVDSYVWNMFGKEMDKSPSSSDETSKGKVVPPGEETSKATVVASSVSSGLRTVTEGVGNVGSYVWNRGWKTSGSQGKEPGHVDENKTNGVNNSLDKPSGVEGLLSPLIGNRQKSIPSSASGNEGKSSDEKENSWTKPIKNLFNPKALGETSPVLVMEQSDIQTSHAAGERKSLWIDHILPSAINVVFGISNDVNDADNVWDDTIPLDFPATSDSHERREILRAQRELSLNNPYILPDTIALLWSHVEKTRFSDWGPYVEGGYGLGFGVAPAIECPGGVADGGQPFMVGHTGGAVGASSAMIIVPRAHHPRDRIPKGVAVVILTNLQSVSLNPLAIEIARLFGQASV